MDFVIGSRGRLGRAIVSSLQVNEVIAPDRTVYADWWQPKAVDKISAFFEKENRSGKEGVVYVTSGVLDPNKPYDDHQAINFLLAKNIIEAAEKSGLRAVTFGTIMEKVIGSDTTNPYVLTKTKLGEFVAECSDLSNPPLHIQIHTLYGIDLPSPFMFLGQIFDALRNKSPFKMTPGNQLREYHHIEDEVKAIQLLVKAKKQGLVQLNHGEAISLKELASYIFKRFNCLELLNIGSSTAPLKENYDLRFERPIELGNLTFRKTLPSIVDYLDRCKELDGGCYV